MRVVVYTPQRLSQELKEEFLRLQKLEDPAPEKMEDGRKGFWSRVKEAFTAG